MIKSTSNNTTRKEVDFDYSKIKPYGDTINDGKIQMSFTLPVEDGEKAVEAAKQILIKMGLTNPSIVYHKKLDNHFTFFNAYGNLSHTIDYSDIKVDELNNKIMNMKEINAYIKKQIKRKLIILGATTGSDAHTVGIDAIINMKGCAGHYGLERYEMIEAYNLGSQVPNEEFVEKAIELKADILLVSQTVTQKDIHIKNLKDLVELLNKKNIREKVILICGGPRMTNTLAKELGYDAGFSQGKYAEDVASYAITEFVRRLK